MNLYGQLYRNMLLPAFDGIVKQRKTVQYWKLAEESQWRSRQELEARQLSDLKALLVYAFANCQYYQEQWSRLGLRPDSIESLDDFFRWPLLTRETIREHRSRMHSRSIGKRITKSTGGSSGEPLVFDLNQDSNDRRTAIMFRGYDWAGSGPGARRLLIWGADLKPAGVWRSLKVFMHHLFEQQRLMNCFEFTASNMRKHFECMQRYRPDTIIAYTNPLYEFSKFLHANSLTPTGIQSIVVGAEKIYGFQRELIETVFGAPVFETYGSREFMLIGAECEHHCGLHLSTENLLVEVLDETGQPTPDGDEGNVVITDLFNTAMPFIRYVNGDRAIAGFVQCKCGRGLPMMRSVVGRQLDILSTPSGAIIPGELFPHLFKDIAAIRRFQVHQYRLDQVEIKIVGYEEISNETCKRLRDRIESSLGNQIHVRLESVADIPLTAAGKHQVVVNHLPRC